MTGKAAPRTKRAPLTLAKNAAAAAPVPAPAPVEPLEKGELKSIAVRLDVARWLRFKSFAMYDGRSMQQIIVDLIDAQLGPE